MPPALSIHVASEEERLEALRNAHEFWGEGRSLEEFLVAWQGSLKKQRAERWVLTLDGKVISALGRYPLEFSHRRRIVPGFVIGDVHTLPEHRGKGLASDLCREVACAAAARGDRLALLFSDVPPRVYEAMGYVTCPAWIHTCEPLDPLTHAGPRAQLQLVQPAENLDLLDAAYKRSSSHDALWVWRSDVYWDFNLRNRPRDTFFLVDPSSSAPAGYVRVAEEGKTLQVIEVALDPLDSRTNEGAYRALADWARSRGHGSMTGWLRLSPVTRRLFSATPRARAIPMLCALQPDIELTPEIIERGCHFWDSDHF